MKALLSEQPGGPETLALREVEAPTPGPGQVRIAVEAASVNYPDVLIIQDLYQFKPQRPFAPGGEAAGVVDAVGAGVTRFAPGDRVLAIPGWGAMAQSLCVAEQMATPIPDAMPFDDAAALMLTYGTAEHALADRAALKSGETLLVLGAAGGTGVAAIELGKAAGARVVAAVSSPEKAAFACACGADETLVYAPHLAEDDRAGAKALTEAVRAATGGGADVVFDAVGGAYAEPVLRAMNWNGRYLVIGFPAGIPKIPLNLPLLKGCAVVGVFWGAFAAREPERQAANAARLFDLYAEGRIKPRIEARYPLERGGEAIAALANRSAKGKLVVNMRP